MSHFLRKFKDKISLNKAQKEDNKENVITGPLGLKVGRFFKINNYDIVLEGEKYSADFSQGNKNNQIVAYGKFNADNLVVHRFYSQDEDMLEIVTSKYSNDDIKEIKFFTLYDEVYPATKEDWDFWLHEDEGIIGDPVFMNKEDKEFFRAWGDSDSHIPPAIFNEAIKDLNGETYRTEHQCMLYFRDIDENDVSKKEYLLVSAEENEQKLVVELMVGVDISENEIER